MRTAGHVSSWCWLEKMMVFYHQEGWTRARWSMLDACTCLISDIESGWFVMLSRYWLVEIGPRNIRWSLSFLLIYVLSVAVGSLLLPLGGIPCLHVRGRLQSRVVFATRGRESQTTVDTLDSLHSRRSVAASIPCLSDHALRHIWGDPMIRVVRSLWLYISWRMYLIFWLVCARKIREGC
jgi:hypothetical protein